MTTRLLRRLPALLVVSLLLAACGDDPVRDADGTVINPGTVSVFELQAGDCLDPDPELTGDIPDIPVVPCDQPHLQEVYASVEHPEDQYPGGAAVAAFADAQCVAQLDTRLGLTLDDGVSYSYMLPTFDGWNVDGDREIICVLVFPDREAAVGSVVAGTAEIPSVTPTTPEVSEPAPTDPAPEQEGEADGAADSTGAAVGDADVDDTEDES